MTREQAIELLQERVKVCESYKGIVKDSCIEEYKEALKNGLFADKELKVWQMVALLFQV